MPVDVSFGTETTPQQRAGSTTTNKKTKTNGRGPKDPAQRRKNRKAPTHAQREHGASFSAPGSCQARIELKRTRKHEKAWGRLPREADQYDDMGVRPENRYIIDCREKKVEEKERERPMWEVLQLSWAEMSPAARRRKMALDRQRKQEVEREWRKWGNKNPFREEKVGRWPNGTAKTHSMSFSMAGANICAAKNAARRKKIGEGLKKYVEESADQKRIDTLLADAAARNDWNAFRSLPGGPDNIERFVKLLDAEKHLDASVPHTAQVAPGAWMEFAKEHGTDGMIGLIELVSQRRDRKGDWAEAMVRQMRHAFEWRMAARGEPLQDSGPVGLAISLRDRPTWTLDRMGPGKQERARPWTEEQTELQQVAHIARIRQCSPNEAVRIWATTRFDNTSKINELVEARLKAKPAIVFGPTTFVPLTNLESYKALKVPPPIAANGQIGFDRPSVKYGADTHIRWSENGIGRIPGVRGFFIQSQSGYEHRDGDGKLWWHVPTREAFDKRVGADLSFRVGTIEKNPGPSEAGCQNRCSTCKRAQCDGKCESRRKAKQAMARAEKEKNGMPGTPGSRKISHISGCRCARCRSKTRGNTRRVPYTSPGVTSEEEAGPSCVRKGETAGSESGPDAYMRDWFAGLSGESSIADDESVDFDTKGKGRAKENTEVRAPMSPAAYLPAACRYYPRCNRGARCPYYHPSPPESEARGAGPSNASNEELEDLVNALSVEISEAEDTIASLQAQCEGQQRIMKQLEEQIKGADTEAATCTCEPTPDQMSIALDRLARSRGVPTEEVSTDEVVLSVRKGLIHHHEGCAHFVEVDTSFLSALGHRAFARLAETGKTPSQIIENPRALHAMIETVREEERLAERASDRADQDAKYEVRLREAREYGERMRKEQEERKKEDELETRRRQAITFSAREIRFSPTAAAYPDGSDVVTSSVSMSTDATTAVESTVTRTISEAETLARNVRTSALMATGVSCVALAPLACLPFGGGAAAAQGALNAVNRVVDVAFEDAMARLPQETAQDTKALSDSVVGTQTVTQKFSVDTVPGVGKVFTGTTRTFAARAPDAVALLESPCRLFVFEGRVWRMEADVPGRLTAHLEGLGEIKGETMFDVHHDWSIVSATAATAFTISAREARFQARQREEALRKSDKAVKAREEEWVNRMAGLSEQLEKEKGKYADLCAAVTHTRRRIRAHFRDGSHRHLLDGHYAWVSTPAGSWEFFSATIGTTSWAARTMAAVDTGETCDDHECVGGSFKDNTNAAEGWDWAGSFDGGTSKYTSAPSMSLDSEVVPKSKIREVNAHVPDVIGQGRAAGSRIARDRYLAVLPMFCPVETEAQKQAKLDACLSMLMKKLSPVASDKPSTPQGQYTKTVEGWMTQVVVRELPPPKVEIPTDGLAALANRSSENEYEDDEHENVFCFSHVGFVCHSLFDVSCPSPPRDVVESVGMV